MVSSAVGRRRMRAQVDGSLVPVTLRISAKDRDYFEHLARLHGSNLSEYLRDLLAECADQVSLRRKLDAIEHELSELKNYETLLHERHCGLLEDVRKQHLATTENVKEFVGVVQSGFGQLFDAFFQLQNFLEQMMAAQGRR